MPTPKRRRSPRLPLIILFLLIAGLTFGGIAVVSTGQDQRGLPIATLSAGDFHALAFLPNAPNSVLFGHHNGLMRSDDGGRSWAPLVRQQGFDVMNMIVRDGEQLQIAAAGTDVFHLSLDEGKTWQPIAHNLPDSKIYALAMNPDNPQHFTAYVPGHGLFVTDAASGQWRELDVADVPVNDTMALASLGGAPEVLLLGTLGSGLWRSADGGATWVRTGAPAEMGSVLALATDPSNRNLIYAGTNRGLFKSADGGNSWFALPYPGANAAVVALHPRTPSVVLTISVSSDGTGSLFRSADGGLSWDE